MKSPNHALQRTAPAVTLAAPPPSPAQPSRQPPPSLSLRSLGAYATRPRKPMKPIHKYITATISLFAAITTATAQNLSDIANWNYVNRLGYGAGYTEYSSPAPGLFESTADGIRIATNSSRGSGEMSSKQSFSLAGATVDFTWSGSGGSSYSQVVLGGITTPWTTDPGSSQLSLINASFGNSYNGSFVASPGQVYQTRLEISSSSFTSRTVERASGSLVGTQSGNYDFSTPLHLLFRQGDTYDSSNSFLSLSDLQIHAASPRLFGLSIGQNDGSLARGDLAAQAVFNKLSAKSTWASAAEGNTTAPLVFADNFTNDLTNQVSLRLDAMSVRPGDTVVFFYNGHGGPYGGSDENPITINGSPNREDETLAGTLSDDTLVQLFNTPKWQSVRKIFLIDSCHSGGFVGSSTTDSGDLEKLTNFAIFASALEDGNAQGDPFDGQGIWSKYLLLPALDDADLTTTGLQVSINSRLGSIVDAFTGQTVPLFDLNAPGSTAQFGITPYSTTSADFDASQPIVPTPEPSAALLTALGTLIFTFSRKRNGT